MLFHQAATWSAGRGMVWVEMAVMPLPKGRWSWRTSPAPKETPLCSFSPIGGG